MKTLHAITTCLLIVAVSGQVKFRSGMRVARVSAAKASALTLCTASNKNKKYCNGDPALEQCDATGLIICTGVGKGIELPCDDLYCKEDEKGAAQCVSTVPDSCPPKDSGFECLAAGVFPHPTDCQKYFNCYDDGANGFIADQYECNELYTFDPSAPGETYCRYVYRLSSPFCVKVTCPITSLKNIRMIYPSFPVSKGEIVATCRGSKLPLVTVCPAGFIANLEPIPAECKIVCKANGKYEFLGDITKYYECVRTVSGAWEAKVKSCFRGYSFNKVTKLCDTAYATSTTVTTLGDTSTLPNTGPDTTTALVTDSPNVVSPTTIPSDTTSLPLQR